MAKRRVVYTRTKVFKGNSVDETVNDATDWTNKCVDIRSGRSIVNMSIGFNPDGGSYKNPDAKLVYVLVVYEESVWDEAN